MLGKTYDSQVCSAARALEFVGERWTLLIVRDAFFAGATRFSDFHKGLGIATNILTLAWTVWSRRESWSGEGPHSIRSFTSTC